MTLNKDKTDQWDNMGPDEDNTLAFTYSDLTRCPGG